MKFIPHIITIIFAILSVYYFFQSNPFNAIYLVLIGILVEIINKEFKK